MSVKLHDWTGDTAYLGKSKAIVVDNKDPDYKGRIRVQSPVFGITGWIPFLVPDDGFYSVPDIGNVVYVEPAGGDLRYPIATALINGGELGSRDIPPAFQREVPTNRGWFSPGVLGSTGRPEELNSGHSLELDDGLAVLDDGSVTHTAEDRGVRVTTSGGHTIRMLEEASDGEQQNRVDIKTSKGLTIELIDDNDGSEPNRIRIKNSTGTIYIDIDMENDIIEIDAENVKLGTNAAEAIVRGDTFRDLFNSHRHVSSAPGVPTGKPIQQMDPSSANTHLSSKHTVE